MWIQAAFVTIAALIAIPLLIRFGLRLGQQGSSAKRGSSLPVVFGYTSVVTYVVALAVFLIVYVTRSGLEHISEQVDGHTIYRGLWQLILVGAGAGVISFLALEFFKRLTPLRNIFNRSRAVRFFGTDPNRLNDEVLDGLGDSRPKETSGPIQSLEGLEVLGAFLPVRVVYASTSTQLAAQLSESLRQLSSVIVATRIGDLSLPDEVMRSLTRAVFGNDRLYRHMLHEGRLSNFIRANSIQDPYSPSAERKVDLLGMEEHIERRVDAFQIELTTDWHLMLRALSSCLAGFFVALSVSAGHLSTTGIVVATAIGVISGGPISWILSDVVRAVEKKSMF